MNLFGLQTTLTQVITAIGGLGTAAFGLVDATKAFGGGVNHLGFKGIKTTVTALTPVGAAAGVSFGGLSQKKLLATLQANWFNGVDLASQKAIAKSLIKLNLTPANAPAVAAATGVDAATLAAIATSITMGVALSSAQSDFFGRFDLIVTALLDEAYQRSDQIFRNGTRAWAMAISIILAFAAAFTLHGGFDINWQDTMEALLVGFLATPLAPIAKDLSTALATAVNTLQLVKK